MNHQDKKVLVTGATGQQGGAVTRHLLTDGWPVRALTRNVNSPALRQAYPGLMTFEMWLRQNGQWSVSGEK